MSRTACSGSAVESTIIALSPPVSAISMASGAAVSASCRSISLATSVEPVKQTPAMRGSAVSGAADRRAVAGQKLEHVFRHAGLAQQFDGAAAISGVCSAGLAMTELPVTSAAAIWPVKMASGKFHGEMQTMAPRACVPGSALAASAGVVAQEVDRFAHFGNAVGQRSCRPRGWQARKTRRRWPHRDRRRG